MQASERDPQGQVNIEWHGSNVRKMLVSTKPPDLRLNIISGLLGELIPSDGTYDAWYLLVEEYSRRLLT